MALEQNAAAAVHVVSGDVLEDFVLIFRKLLSKVGQWGCFVRISKQWFFVVDGAYCLGGIFGAVISHQSVRRACLREACFDDITTSGCESVPIIFPENCDSVIEYGFVNGQWNVTPTTLFANNRACVALRGVTPVFKLARNRFGDWVDLP